MTVQSILTRAEKLLEEMQGERGAADRRSRLLSALDSALGEIARVFPVQARCRVTVTGGSAPLPGTVLTPRGLYCAGKRVPLTVEEGRLLAEDGAYTLVYYRVPPEASAMQLTDTPPFPEDVLRALPFYCAAVVCMGEDASLYTRLMEQYNTKLAAALGYRPAASVEGGGSL